MCTAQQETVTRLLNGVADGEAAAAEELLPMVYDELRSLAAALFRNQKAGHTLQPTALVHEAYMKLVGRADIQWSSRNQFFVLAADGHAKHPGRPCPWEEQAQTGGWVAADFHRCRRAGRRG